MSTIAALADCPVLVVTRFSFLGQSGWKSDASRDETLLFQPARLAGRLALFSTLTLPALVAQTDQDFHHLILTSKAMPAAPLAALQAACLAAYGDPSRFTVLAARPAPARSPLRQFMSDRWPGQMLLQVVLDDDDGLAVDFIATMRRDLAALQAATPDLAQDSPYFLSYPLGYGLSLRSDTPDEAALSLHRYPFINLGLTMVARAEAKNILAIDHLAAPRKFGGKLLPQRPMFVRSLHDFNDSRVTPGERWEAVPDWRADPDLEARFPWLFAASVPWRIPAG